MRKVVVSNYSEERRHRKEYLVFTIVSMAVLSAAFFITGYHFGYRDGRNEKKQNQQEIVLMHQEQELTTIPITEREKEGDLPRITNDGR